MKQIIAPNEAVASSNWRLERRQMPQMGDILPEYRAINNFFIEQGGDATIGYMDVLRRTSAEKMARQQEQYDRIETNQAIERVDQAFATVEQEFLQNNPSGKGYTEFVTNTYTGLYKQAMENASNANVSDYLQNFCQQKKSKLAHNAFQAEQSMYQAYVLNDCEPRINSLMNTAVKHPEQYDILETQLDAYLSPLQGTMAASAFENFRKEKHQDLVYSTALGLVDQNPQMSSQYLEKPAYKELSPSRYMRLKQYAKTAIADQQRQARREAVEAARLNAIKQQEIVDSYKLALACNEPSVISEIEKDSILSEHNKKKLLIQAARSERKNERYTAVTEYLNKSIYGEDTEIEEVDSKTGEKKLVKYSKYEYPLKKVQSLPFEYITPKDIERYYTDVVKIRNEFAEQRGEQPLSLAQKIDIAKQIERVYDGNLKPLKMEIANVIKNTNNPKELMDACVSLVENENVAGIAGIESDLAYFARLAVIMYKGDNNEGKLINERDQWLKKDKDSAILKFRNEAWRTTNYGSYSAEKRREALSDFYKKAGYTRLLGFRNSIFGSPNEMMIREKVEPVLKEVFLKTGDITKAEVIAIDYMHSFVKSSDINGKEEIMINPPTTDNTGFYDVKKAVSYAKKKYVLPFYPNKKEEDIKIEAVELDKPKYRFYFFDKKGQKIYCLNDRPNPLIVITIQANKAH